MSRNLTKPPKIKNPDPRIEYRMRRINDLNHILKTTSEKIEILNLKKNEYIRTKDQSELRRLSNEMNKIAKKVNSNLQLIREKMKVMENKIRDMGKERAANIKSDTDLRMMKTVLSCFQSKSVELLKRFSKFQMEQKKFAKQFAVDSLMLTQNEYTKEDLEQFTFQQLQELQVEQKKKQQGEDEDMNEVNNALDEIREKVMEIKKIEKQVNELVQMIGELQMIIQAQTEVVDSIFDNVQQIDNYIQETKKHVDESAKLMTSANEKLWCFFAVMVVIMIFIMNKILGSFF